MRPHSHASLWHGTRAAEKLANRYISERDTQVRLSDLTNSSILGDHVDEFRGRSVLISTNDQLSTGLLLLELDGIARRLILVPPDPGVLDFSYIIASADVDIVISDRLPPAYPKVHHMVLPQTVKLEPATPDRTAQFETGWVLLTSGTTGRPRLVEHTFRSLTGAIATDIPVKNAVVWSTFYDIRRFGGLQIFLRAVLTGASLLLRSTQTSIAEFLIRAGGAGVTHISGTPSHWRLALMSPAASTIEPKYIRLSGEIADQAILDALRSTYPGSTVVHAFASTEAGVAFEVRDGVAGFPATLLEQHNHASVAINVEDGSLRVRSSRIAGRYLGGESRRICDADGFVDTGDMIQRQGDRCYFAGRRDGVINVGGMKVHPEEVEAVINRHPCVRMSLVKMRKSPVTGSLVVADVVLKTKPGLVGGASKQVENEILQICSHSLPRHKVPALIHIVNSLDIEKTGKMARSYA